MIDLVKVRGRIRGQGPSCKIIRENSGPVYDFKKYLGLKGKCRDLIIIRFKQWRICLQK